MKSRTLEYRTNILRALVLWYRDVLITVCGMEPALLHYPQYADHIQREAEGLTQKKALRKIDIVEKMADQLARNLPAAQVFGLGFRGL